MGDLLRKIWSRRKDSNLRPADYETPSDRENASILSNFADEGCRMRQIAALGRNPGATGKLSYRLSQPSA